MIDVAEFGCGVMNLDVIREFGWVRTKFECCVVKKEGDGLRSGKTSLYTPKP